MNNPKERIFWDKPAGELLLFNSEEDVLQFFCKLNLSPEELEEYGVIPKDGLWDEDGNWRGNSTEEDNWGDIVQTRYTLPVFNKNIFFADSEESAYKATLKNMLHKRHLTLDKEIWKEFPCVAFIWLEDTYDRYGDVNIRLFEVQPLSEISTVESLIKHQERFQQVWIENHEKHCEWERMKRENRNVKT